MPNLYYMFVQFIHLMALSVWVGGSVIIGFIAAPVIFSKLDSRTLAGEIVGAILNKFNTIIYFCIFALIITSIIKYTNWENMNPFIATRYMAIFIMSLSSIYSARIVFPEMNSLKLKIKVFEDLSPDNYNRLEFNRLHRISLACMTLNLVCGIISILLA